MRKANAVRACDWRHIDSTELAAGNGGTISIGKYLLKGERTEQATVSEPLCRRGQSGERKPHNPEEPCDESNQDAVSPYSKQRHTCPGNLNGHHRGDGGLAICRNPKPEIRACQVHSAE